MIGLLLACSDDDNGRIVDNGGNGNGGSPWQLLGGALSEDYAFWPSLALDGSNPVVVYTGFNRIRYNVYVKRWDGSKWVQLGDSLNTEPNIRAQGTSLTIDASGRPVVALYERVAYNWNVLVKRWEGSSWTQLGGTLDLVQDADAYGATVTADGNDLVVGWIEAGSGDNPDNAYVKRWNGSSWVQLGDTLNMFREYAPGVHSIVIDASGHPVVAVEEADGDDNDVYIHRWEDPDWVEIGHGVDPNLYGRAFNPTLDVGLSGDLFIAYEDFNYIGKPYDNTFVRRWTGSIWELLGPAVAELVLGAYDPSMAVDPSGRPVVAYHGGTEGEGYISVYVKRWDGSHWIKLGEELDVDPSMDAKNASLALDPSGNPVVAWNEIDRSDSNKRFVYVKRFNVQP